MAVRKKDRVREQDPNAHVFWTVNWKPWLDARGFAATEVVAVEWTLVPAVTGVPTHTDFNTTAGDPDEGKARAWFKDLAKGTVYSVTSKIRLPEPTVGAGEVTDEFTFRLRVKEN